MCSVLILETILFFLYNNLCFSLQMLSKNSGKLLQSPSIPTARAVVTCVGLCIGEGMKSHYMPTYMQKSGLSVCATVMCKFGWLMVARLREFVCM